MRLFVALDIDDAVRKRIAHFVDGVRGFAPEARWVQPESLHVTLKFIGERPENTMEQIGQTLGTIQAGVVALQVRGYGFFPTVKAPRIFWVGIEAGPELASVAAAVDGKLTGLGIPKEEHAFSPHLTLARRGGGSGSPRWGKDDGPNQGFKPLQEKLSARPAPEFGAITAREFFLYKSELSPKGSKYTKLAGFALK